MSEDLRYPIGKFDQRSVLTPDDRRLMIEQLAEAPVRLRNAVADLGDLQFDTPYRDGGWTVRQVIHHLPDSQLNGYVRMKLALTEDAPTVKTYEEARWAELGDSRDTPVETSLALLESLHGRWTALLRSLDADQFQRTINHPDNGIMTVDKLLGMYAWHPRHHTAHVTALRQRMKW